METHVAEVGRFFFYQIMQKMIKKKCYDIYRFAERIVHLGFWILPKGREN